MARVLTTSSHETLYIPRAWDVFLFRGYLYRFGPEGLTLEYRRTVGGELAWTESHLLHLEAA